MDDPVKEIEQVIQLLVNSRPSVQRQTIEKYFTRDAAFSHPFCRTGSFDGSRFLIGGIYRWYKIMSPRIALTVNSVAYDPQKLILFVSMSQVFRIWIIPFYKAPVDLTSVLHLQYDKFDRKYYLKSQEDLYQTDQFVKFFWPGGFLFVWLWQIFSTFACFLLALIFWPVSWFEEHSDEMFKDKKTRMNGRKTPFEELYSGRGGPSSLVTVPAVQQR